MVEIANFLLHDIFHPLHGDGYQFWSGIGGLITIGGGVWVFVRRHNCHAKWCWRIGKHTVSGTPYVVCAKHHPHVPDKGASAEHIDSAHQVANHKSGTA